MGIGIIPVAEIFPHFSVEVVVKLPGGNIPIAVPICTIPAVSDTLDQEMGKDTAFQGRLVEHFLPLSGSADHGVLRFSQGIGFEDSPVCHGSRFGSVND